MNLTKEDILKIEFDSHRNFNGIGKIKGVSTDSRTIKPGEIFFALQGENFNGHEYIDMVFEKKAALAVVNKIWFEKNPNKYNDKPLLIVNDTIKSLGDLSNIYRKKFHNPVIALTGSNGKTTTKEMIYAVLSQKYKVLKTEGNLNNHIGVPLMIFKLNDKFDFVTLEMGTNHFGEIDYLCKVAEPDFGLITNIGHAHLEFFEDLKGVTKAKGELFNYLAKYEKMGFVNGNDQNVMRAAKVLADKIIYGFDGDFDVTARFKGVDEHRKFLFSVMQNKKSFNIKLNMIGKHNMHNALAAIAIGLKFGISKKDIQNAIGSFKPTSKRMELLKINNFTVINDCYNSNPDSARAALESLKGYPSKKNKIVIFGDMLEIGKNTINAHREIGKTIVDMGFQKVFLFGDLSKNIYDEIKNKVGFCSHYSDKNKLSLDLGKIIQKGDVILLKGSRGMKMETILEEIKNF